MVEVTDETETSQEISFLTEEIVDKIIHKIDDFFTKNKKTCVQGTCSQISAQNLAILCTNNDYNSIEVTKEKMPTTQVSNKNFDQIFKNIKYFIFIRSKGKDFKGAVIINQMPEVLIINDKIPERISSFLQKKYKMLSL